MKTTGSPTTHNPDPQASASLGGSSEREVAPPHGHAGTCEVTPGRLKSHHKHSCTSLSAWPRAS